MGQRERLIELLKSPHKAEQLRKIGANIGKYEDDCIEAMVADFLLANGVIVPPCKVGDTVYRTIGNYCGEKIFKGVVDQISIYNEKETIFWVYGHPLGFGCDDIGKTVFLSREEAEKALAERSGNEI